MATQKEKKPKKSGYKKPTKANIKNTTQNEGEGEDLVGGRPKDRNNPPKG